MLPRAALRAPSSCLRLRLRSHACSYASSSRPPRPPPPPPPPPAASKPPARTPPTPRARPGTSPSPSITTRPAASPIQGTRPVERAAKHASPASGASAAQEPIAQQTDADQPVAGTVRDTAQDKIAQSEQQQQQPPDTPQPTPTPELQQQTPDTPTAPQHTQPLPDLRHGIPSTFDFEFGQTKQGTTNTQHTAEDPPSDDRMHVTTAPEESQQRRDRGEREYDRSAYETSQDRKRNQLVNYMYASILFAGLAGAAYFARPFDHSEELPRGIEASDLDGWAPGKMYARVQARMGNQMGYYTEPSFPKLLPDIPESQKAMYPQYTLVLSLEDLLIHTTWDTKHGYRTAKRPGLDYFIRYLQQYYELVLFTSTPSAIAAPMIAKLDPYHFIQWPLGREATKYEKGEYVKDLSYLNRPLNKTIIVDTHAGHVKNQPENAIILPKWSGDPKDTHTKDLVALIPFLEYVATMGAEDVRTVLKSFEGKSVPEEFARREAEARKRFNEQLAEERKRRPKRSIGSIAGGLGIKGGAAMGGGMVLADGQSVAEGLAQGKMLSDQIREQGQKQYEYIEKQIRENGEQWLKDEAEELKKQTEASMKDMKQGALGWFTGGGSSNRKA